MRYEVAPLHPDIVVPYEGIIEFHAADILPESAETYARQARPFMDMTWLPMERTSALASRVYELLFRRGGPGVEPPKPAHRLTFDLTQSDPDLDDTHLPFGLYRQTRDLREIETIATGIGARTFLTSFVALAQDGLRLDPARHRLILKVLNDEYAPLTYKEIRDGVDFENRVHRKVAALDHLPFLDMDRYFPQDPDFFADMVHFNGQGGNRLQGWIVAQLLAPYIERAIRDGTLPRPAYDADPQAIAWATAAPIKFNLACLPDGPMR
jgi:hypothetical protein